MSSKTTQRVLGFGVALLATGAMLTMIDGYAKHGSQGVGSDAAVVRLEAVVVSASRSSDAAPAITAAAVATSAAARL